MDEPAVKISVVIATHNRPAQLLDTLSCLYKQNFSPREFEILVVDDANPPVVQLPANPPVATRLFHTTGKTGPGSARNKGVEEAQGELLVFTDDDCLPSPEWLSEMWIAHQQNPHAMLGGKLYNAVPEFLGAEASQVISDIVYAWYNRDPANCRFFSTNNSAVPRMDFEQLGLFCPAFQGASEDRDLCDRWRGSGRTLRYVPGAIVGHAHKLTVKKFTRQHFHYGRGAATFHQQRAERNGGSIIDEMSFHRALPSLLVKRLKKEKPTRWIPILAMISIWQIANALGYFYERFRPGKK